MNKMVVTPSKLLNMLQVAENLIKKEKPTVILIEEASGYFDTFHICNMLQGLRENPK
ncbi:hypothetical protein QUC31_004429 [Theobroma cacao]